jgi:FkbH-like protein
MSARACLPWLPEPPADFRATAKAIETATQIEAAAVVRLAATAMDLDQLRRFAKLIRTAKTALVETGITPLTLGLVGSHTLDYLPDALIGTGLRHGLLIETVSVPYGQMIQSVLDPAGPLAVARPDAILVSLDPQALGLARPQLDAATASAVVDGAIAQTLALRDGIRSVIGATPVFQTIPSPATALFGGLDARFGGTARAMIEAFNRRLADEVTGSGDLLVDIAFAAAQFGLERWHDPRGWHNAKLPFSLEAAPLHADHVARLLGALKGKSRKCLVLDLDNTVWGGVIGDDGLEGIKLGQGNGVGEAFLAIQQLAIDLRARGIILAVCSKNEESNARSPFREHREMLIKEEHIAAFVANWTDKATNLRSIAKTLNIGTDALVFLDDNPAEREIVRRELPEVAVPEIGDDPALYPERLSRAGYFEAITFADEDRLRADMYQANSARLQAASLVTNIADYLRSLDMVLTARPFEPQTRARIAQLVNKSNQFNLTTKRYSEADISSLEVDPDKFTLQLRLADTFGDNGMISVIIFDRAEDVWRCDTWLMSCRVLGRRVEEAALAIIAAAATAEGVARLEGAYLPSAKNGLVASHFEKLGFQKAAEETDGSTFWTLSLFDYQPPTLPMTINLES